MNYYLADTHLGHQNILRLNNRPFPSIKEMDETIIKNCNEMVSNTDELYIVGDLCYKSGKNPVEYLKKLNGKKHLITGNHDGRILKDPVARKYFVEIKDIETIWDNNQMIVLCHYPLVEWNGFFRNSILLYGHIHNNVKNDTYQIVKRLPNAYNVGADILGFRPQTLENVIKLNKEFFANN